MNLAFGTAGVVLGLVASLCAVATLAVGLTRRRPDLVRLGAIYVWIVLFASVLAVFAMQRALITRDFTVLFVAENGSTKTPTLFNVATMWSALEGSILLWVLFLGGYTALVARRFRAGLSDPLVGWALLTMFVVCAFFFFLLAGPANPFKSFSPPVGYDGPGPNPLLQNNVLMAFHPPMLYLGYVGFTVPFAFAIAALVTGRVGEGWLVETRRWTLVAWGFLTVGIVLGSWWSYEVLGWGGYWAWDPVENASFLPWLTGTAYLHSVMVQERRGMLRVWNLSLLCATFSLTILGTFITRSGVLDSVHAFTESGIGPAILAFFALTVAVTIGLIAWRGDRLRSPGRIDSPISREGAFLANNLLFAAFVFIVLLGTVFPLLVEAINGKRVSVGVPYFNRMTMPVGIALLFLMAVAPVLPWRKASGELLRHRLLWPAWIGTLSVVVAVLLGQSSFAALVAFGLGGFAAGSAGRQLVLATRRQGWRGLVGRANGGMIVHIGVVVIAVAFAASASNVRQQEFTLNPGDTATFAGHTLTFQRMNTVVDENKTKTQALVLVDGQGPYAPGINTFPGGSNVIGTPSVRSTWRNDVALSLLDVPADDTSPIQLRVTIQPLIMWLWIGGGIMAVGTVFSAFPGRRRRGIEPVSAPVPERRRSGPPSVTTRSRVVGRPDDTPVEPERGAGVMTDVLDDGDELDELDAVDARRRGHVARNAALAVGVVLIALVALLATAKTNDQRQPEARILGQAVPAVQGSTMGGGTYDIDDHLGNWVVVNFFASWCTPCRIEQPELVKFDGEHTAAGDVEIVSVVFQDKEEDVKAFFEQSGADWPVIVGDTGSIALQFGVTAVPESYIVSPDGQVVAKFENVTATELDAVIAQYAAAAVSSSTVAP